MSQHQTTPGMEPEVLRHLAAAIESLQMARTLTGWGFVADHCDNALSECAHAIRAGLHAEGATDAR